MQKREKKKNVENAKSKAKSSKEAEGMYETKFPVINSQIEYSDMNGEVPTWTRARVSGAG